MVKHCYFDHFQATNVTSLEWNWEEMHTLPWHACHVATVQLQNYKGIDNTQVESNQCDVMSFEFLQPLFFI